MLLIGWDWASTSHAVTVLDTAGAIVSTWTLSHTQDDLDAALARLASYGDPTDLPVAIERSDGVVVERLLAAGLLPTSRVGWVTSPWSARERMPRLQGLAQPSPAATPQTETPGARR